MEKLNLKTPDFTQENIAKLAELFPNCVTEKKNDKGEIEHAIDFDALRQEFSETIVEGSQERYSLNWPGKREALVTANTPISKTLRPCRDESVDFDTTKNIFIEGDNLDALKLIQETYLNKVKMIYIDPPYNTGNDFIYNDNFTADKDEYDEASGQRNAEGGRLVANTETNGRYHSDWLSMMYPRLKLARNLLRDDGVFFISIDDNEQANLKRVCDEVFGEENFISSFIWEKKYTTSNNITGVSSVHEYIVCYAKQREKISEAISRLAYTDEARARYTNPDNDPRGDWMDVSYHGPKTPAERPNLNYAIIHPKTGAEICPIEKSWAYEKASHEKHVLEGRLWWGKDFSYKEPRLKKFISEIQGGLVPKSLLGNKAVGGTSVGRNDLRTLFGNESGALFDNPKPCSLMEHLLNIGLKDQEIILDFFSGSGSTSQAVMQLNAQDGAERYCISVQIAEKTEEDSEAYKAGYASIADLTKERIRRAGNKIKQDNASKDGIENLDIGFRVFKIDSSNMVDVTLSPDETKPELFDSLVGNIKEERTPEDLLFQVLLDWGVDLSLPIERQEINGKEVFFVDSNALVACFDDDINEDFVKELAQHQPLRVVFRDDGFASDSVKINVEQIFKLKSPSTDIKVI
jgi:adenine-specific DNA-methyltransferase